MAMGYREKLKGGHEWDAFTGWRKVIAWNHSARTRIKKAFRRRVRRKSRQQTPE